MDFQEIMKQIQTKEEFSRMQKAQVLYVAEKQTHTCHNCQKNDGKKFDLDAPDLPQLPIHPNCRCKYVLLSDTEKDVSEDVEKYRITQTLKKKHAQKEEEARSLAEQILKARHENKKLREQKLFLLFNGRYLMSSDGKLLLEAVSGKSISTQKKTELLRNTGVISETVSQKFDYSYARQGLKNEGGLPRGLYHIKAYEERSAFTSPRDHIVKTKGWGSYSWSLHPDKKTDMRSRSGFFIHGGWRLGSAGCIDLKEKDREFQKYFESSKLLFLYVYVSYDNEKTETEEINYYPIEHDGFEKYLF